MERVIITVRPAPGHGEMLRVADAMEQVMDTIRLLENASQSVGGEALEWRLESASAGSPFHVTAVSASPDPAVDLSHFASAAKAELAAGIRGLINNRVAAPWMDLDSIRIARAIFSRVTNGVGSTEVVFAPNDTVAIDRGVAESGLLALEAITPTSIETEIGRQRVMGEIEGALVAVGRHYNKPAIQVLTPLYGRVWCRLTNEQIRVFGDGHTLSEVWQGKVVGVDGQLIYGAGSRLQYVLGTSVRIIFPVPPVDLDTVLDPEFTAGLDPVEYVRRLHGGELA